jgi:GMP synthase (glutamine-hydrolysing)
MKNNIHAHRILIIDFGSQYTQLIARRVREIGVYCEIWPYDNCEEQIKKQKPLGLILSGGPETVTGDDTPRAPSVVFELGVPILGICYGMQTMAQQLGGRVESSDKHEYGYAKVRAHNHSRLLKDIEDHTTPEGYGMLDVWMSHGDRVTELPENFVKICSTENAPLAGMADEDRQYYGIQFHPEVTHTTQGVKVLARFVREICGCDALWNPSNIIEDSINQMKDQIGDGKVVLGLSGGVDSSVVAALLHKAIGGRLTCIFVDNGLLRLNEGDEVMSTFAEHMGVKVIRVDAESRFLAALSGEADPEKKRKIIGNLFIEIFEEEAGKLRDVHFLAQGTIYPDVIESAGAASGKAHVIKSHHNVGGLPEHMRLKLVEPLRELFKDEVRRVGDELGLPKKMVYRHPFPGPGLAIRIPGEITKEKIKILQDADDIYIKAIKIAGLYNDIWQAFSVLLPVKTVGVMGDQRTYEYVLALRAVTASDGMTADYYHFTHEFLSKVSTKIVNEVRGVNRVVYDVTSKPPSTIEWE